MTKQNDKQFSFPQAVAETLSLYPETKRRVIFVNTDDSHTEEKTVKHGHWLARLRQAWAYGDQQINRLIREAKDGNNSFAFRSEKNREYLLVLNESDAIFPKEFSEQEKYYTFDHELGHILSPYEFKKYEGGKSFDECVADAYACLRSIQRFGEDSAILQMTRWYRAFEALRRNTVGHMTTSVIDRIIEDKEKIDFTKMSANDTLKVAVEYAVVHGATLEQEKDVLNTFDLYNLKYATGHDDWVYQLQQLSRTTLSSSNDYTFKIGVRAFQPFLYPEGIVINGTHVQLDEKKRDIFRSQFQNEAMKRGMKDLHNELNDTKDHMFISQQKKAQAVNKPAPPSFKFSTPL